MTNIYLSFYTNTYNRDVDINGSMINNDNENVL